MPAHLPTSPPIPRVPSCLRRFLLTPGPADKPLCCKILRSGGGLLKGAPQYSLLVEQEGGRGGVFLVAARKRKAGPGGATYVLSVRRLGRLRPLAVRPVCCCVCCVCAAQQRRPAGRRRRQSSCALACRPCPAIPAQVDQHDVSRHSASFAGKLRSNFMGTEFVLASEGSGAVGADPQRAVCLEPGAGLWGLPGAGACGVVAGRRRGRLQLQRPSSMAALRGRAPSQQVRAAARAASWRRRCTRPTCWAPRVPAR